MKSLKIIILLGVIMILKGCSLSITDYAETKPSLDLKDYFTGSIKAWGIVQDRKGKITRRFDVSMNGSWDGDVGTLREVFNYYDGEIQERVWTIRKISDNKYEGTAKDILKKATGTIQGSTMRWSYKMEVPVKQNVFTLTFDDWMFLMNDGVLINRSYLKKFGFTVAELTLFMQKQN